jgi:glutamate racemase
MGEYLMEDVVRNCPIGVFDSGIGGLTVVKELLKTMPFEDIVYFGDTARLPYGSKSNRLITRYSVENSIFLHSKNVKMIVIACNTASAASADYLRSFIKLPVIGVIECGAMGAVRLTKNKRVGVIGTKSTIKSGAYAKTITNLDSEITVFESSTPLLVHLVEENWIGKEITTAILKEYLDPLFENDIDTLILGCTHYPLLKEQINDIAGNIRLVDSSKEIALLALNTLKIQNILSGKKDPGTTSVYLSDIHPEFSSWATKFLGKEIAATLIDIDQHGI